MATTIDPVYGASGSEREALLTLCHDLEAAGIWVYPEDNGGLLAGPAELVAQHQPLLERLRTHKAAIVRLLQDCLATDLFCKEGSDPRFAREVCPDCKRECYVIHPPRRLEVHRTPDGTAECPGSERAQQACVTAIIQAFIADRCVPRRMAVLTWYGLRGALQAWCTQRGWLLPPRPYVIAWMNSHYTPVGNDEDVPRWAGLALRIEEWLGDDETPTKGDC